MAPPSLDSHADGAAPRHRLLCAARQAGVQRPQAGAAGNAEAERRRRPVAAAAPGRFCGGESQLREDNEIGRSHGRSASGSRHRPRLVAASPRSRSCVDVSQEAIATQSRTFSRHLPAIACTQLSINAWPLFMVDNVRPCGIACETAASCPHHALRRSVASRLGNYDEDATTDTSTMAQTTAPDATRTRSRPAEVRRGSRLSGKSSCRPTV